MKDYYKILGVSRIATDQEIKKAYRALAFKFHPDRNSDPYAANFIKEINEAYDVLGDEQKKIKYNYRFDNKTTYNKTTYSSTTRRPKPPVPKRYTTRKKEPIFDFSLWAYRAKFLSGFVLLYCILLCLDFFIASDYNNVRVLHMEKEFYKQGKRGTVSHSRYFIEGDKVNFTISSINLGINEGDTLSATITPIFGIAKACCVHAAPFCYEAEIYSIYSPMYFVVLACIGFAAAAIVTKPSEQSLTYTIACSFIFLFILFIASRS